MMQRNPSYNFQLQQIQPTVDDLSYEEIGPPEITNVVVNHPQAQDPNPGTKLSKVARVVIATTITVAVVATVLAVVALIVAISENDMRRELLPNTPNRESKKYTKQI